MYIQNAIMFEERLQFAEVISTFSCLNKRQIIFFLPFAASPLEYQFQEKEKKE